MGSLIKNIALSLTGLFFLMASHAQYSVEEFQDEGFENVYKQTQSYQDFIEYDQKTTEFDREKWEGIRQNIIDQFSGEQYEGVTEIEESDNPYRQSQEGFRKYWKEKNKKRVKRLPKKKVQSRQRDPINMPSMNISPFWSNFIMVLAILGLATLIFFLFFKAANDQGKKKIHGDIEGIIPTAIPKSELELRLEEALAKKDYREAIRIYFIFTIRGLIKKDLIEWEKEKTNFSYLIEMRGNPLESQFESCVSVYEIVWYGEREVSLEEYKLLEPRFKKLVEILDK
ncbi:MAG: hypothetical protein ACPGVD_01445 [Flavobacteriales bacterium]